MHFFFLCINVRILFYSQTGLWPFHWWALVWAESPQLRELTWPPTPTPPCIIQPTSLPSCHPTRACVKHILYAHISACLNQLCSTICFGLTAPAAPPSLTFLSRSHWGCGHRPAASRPGWKRRWTPFSPLVLRSTSSVATRGRRAAHDEGSLMFTL